MRQRGCFDIPEASKALLAEHRGMSNPELLFFEDECEAREGAEIVCGDPYGRYVEWCRAGGHRALANGEFGRALYRRFPKVERARRRRGDKIPWVYVGVACSYCSYVPVFSGSLGEGHGEEGEK